MCERPLIVASHSNTAGVDVGWMEEHAHILFQRGFFSHLSVWLIELLLLWLFTFRRLLGRRRQTNLRSPSEDTAFSLLAGSGGLYSYWNKDDMTALPVQSSFSFPLPFSFSISFPSVVSPQSNSAKELRDNTSDILIFLQSLPKSEAEEGGSLEGAAHWPVIPYIHSSQLLQLIADFCLIIFHFLSNWEAKGRWGEIRPRTAAGWRRMQEGHRRIARMLGAGDRNLAAGAEVELQNGRSANRTEDIAVCASAGSLKLVTRRRGNPANKSLPVILIHLAYFLCRT